MRQQSGHIHILDVTAWWRDRFTVFAHSVQMELYLLLNLLLYFLDGRAGGNTPGQIRDIR